MKDTLLLFDLDGTLWDSADSVAESWNEIFQRETSGLVPLTGDDVRGVMGMTMKEISGALYPDTRLEYRDKIFDECCRYEVEYLYTHCGILYPDFRSTLETLREEGFSLAVVSNCQLGYIDAFLSASGSADLFLDYEEWERTGLPKYENIQLVMNRNGFTKGVYIGDTKKDQEAAILAGIPFIHACYGFGKAENPDGIIRCLSDLPSELSRLLN